MGERYLCVASKNRLRDLKDIIISAMEGKEIIFYQFDKECSWEAINAIVNAGREAGAQAIIGVGGGKVADTVKVAVDELGGLPLAIIPTIAATDAYTSAAALIYRDDGTIEEVKNYPRSPEVVLADTEILLKGPARLYISGMGDALSTYVGGVVCQDHFFENHFGGVGTHTALAIAKLSYDMLMQYGRQAKEAAENHVLTDAYNAITEVNILMSGLGFENNGSASDHCFYFGTLALTEREEYVYHGEGVAFSTCCQLVMQGATNEQLDEVYRFLRDVGLPITFDDMHLSDLTDQEYDIMTKAVLKEQFIHHHPFTVTYEMIMGAYKTADAIGHLYHQGKSLI